MRAAERCRYCPRGAQGDVVFGGLAAADYADANGSAPAGIVARVPAEVKPGAPVGEGRAARAEPAPPTWNDFGV